MHVQRIESCRPHMTVGRVHPGRPVEFETKFHQDCRHDDVFMVCDVCPSYVPEGRRDRVIGVVNIRSGKLSFVSEHRRVCVLTADVTIGGR